MQISDQFTQLCDKAEQLAFKPAVDRWDAALKHTVLECSSVFRSALENQNTPRALIEDALSAVESLSSTELNKPMLPYPDAQQAFANLKYAGRFLKPD